MSKLTEHYRQLLGLDASWEVSEVSLSLEEKRVEIALVHRGSRVTWGGSVLPDSPNAYFPGATTRTYDADGRTTQIASPQGTIHYEHDNLGRLTRTYTGLADPTDTSIASDGKAITDTRYTYDELGRLKTVTVVERNDAPVTESPTKYRYDKNGNLDLIELPNSVLSDYVYDDLNRLDDPIHFVDGNGNDQFDGAASSDTLLSRFDYTVRADGKRIQERETTETASVETDVRQTDWVYDELGRLTEERHDVSGGSTEDFIARYGFDLASNRVRMEKDNGNADPNPAVYNADETTDYVYDQNDRLQTEDKVGTGAAYIEYAYRRTTQTGKTVYTDSLKTTKTSDTTYTFNERWSDGTSRT